MNDIEFGEPIYEIYRCEKRASEDLFCSEKYLVASVSENQYSIDGDENTFSYRYAVQVRNEKFKYFFINILFRLFTIEFGR